MLKQTNLFLLAILMSACLCAPLSARMLHLLPGGAIHLLDATETDRDRDGLVGPVRRIRTETAKLLNKGDKWIEGTRVVLETATYDMKGVKVDNAYFLSASGSLTGKEVYKYDDKGNIVEMTLFNTDGSVLSKEVYKYEFDAVGNWTKMTTSVALIENGQMHFEPTEVTYRMIAYYMEDTIANKMLQPASNNGAAATVQTASATIKTATPAPVASTQSSAAHASVKKIAAPTVAVPSAANLAIASNVTLNMPTTSSTTSANSTTAMVKVDEDAPPPPKMRGVPLKPVSGGVLNGKAVVLPKPDYPEIARRAHATGTVVVEVVIDLSGKVISAHAISGPVLLKGAAEQAAMQARFSPTLLSGQPVRMTGTINYTFSL